MIGTSLLFSGSIAGLLGPGDIATPTAGYSLRPLSVSYSGAVVRVRRSGDNEEKDFNASGITDGQLSDFLNVFTESGHILNVYEDFKRRNVLTKPTTFYNFEDVSLVCNCIEESSGLIAYDALANMVSHQVAVYTDLDYPTIDDISLISPCNDGQADELNAFDELLNLTTQNDGYVVTWYDQFGSNDATNSTAAEQPKIWDSTTGLLTEGGRPAIEFDGSDDFLSLNSIYFDNIFISIVGRDNDNLEGAFISGGDDGNNRFDFGTRTSTDTRILILESGVTERIEETVTDYTNAQHLFTATNTLLAVDGSIVSTGLIQVDILAYTDNFRIGQRHIAGVVTHSMIGTIQEIILYTSDQSANRTKIEDNINAYYDIY